MKQAQLGCSDSAMATDNSQSYNDQIKRKDKSAVNGYIREIEDKSFSNKDSFYKTIPMIINYLCIKYYHQSKDRFHPKLHGMHLKVTNDEITGEPSIYSSESAFLSNVVSKGIHRWCFKIKKGVKFIGICNNSFNFEESLNCYYYIRPAVENKAYGINLSNGRLRGPREVWHKTYCSSWNCGDIVDMVLDLNCQELKYIINDKDYGKAFDIPPAKYRAAICMNHRHSIKLMKYDKK